MVFDFNVFFEACKSVVIGKPDQVSLGMWLFGFDERIRDEGLDKSYITRLKQANVMITDPKTGKQRKKYSETGGVLEKALVSKRSRAIVSYFRECFKPDTKEQIRIRSAEDVIPVFSRLLDSAENMSEQKRASIRQYACRDTLPELFASLLYFSVTGDVLLIPPMFARNLPTGLQQRDYWLPRKTEHKQLRQLLDAGEKEIFVVGEAGLGKTEFVIAFAYTEREYDFHFATYCNSLQDVVCSLNFEDWEPETFDAKTNQMVLKSSEQQYREKIQLLRKYKFNDNVVLIIDHFDGEAQMLLEDPVRDELSRLDIRVVYTTRMPLTAKAAVKIEHFSVNALEPLVNYHIGKKYSYHQLTQLVMQVNCNTLLVDLLARLLSNSLLEITPETLLTALKKQKWGKIREKISGEYNRNDSERTILNHLLTLFDLSALSEDACYVLSCTALLPAEGFNSALFLQCLGKEEKWLDVVNNLRRSGWIGFDRQKTPIFVQPLVREACIQHERTRPTSQMCGAFIQRAIQTSEDPNLPHASVAQLASLYLNVYRLSMQDLLERQNRSAWEDFDFGICLHAALQTARRCGAHHMAINILSGQISVMSKIEGGLTHIPYLALCMAEVFCQCNDDQLAISFSQQILSKCNALHSRFYSLICGCYSRLGNHEESVDAGLAALKFASQDPISEENATIVANRNLAVAYSGKKDYERSLHYAKAYWNLLHSQNPSAEEQIHACFMMSSLYYSAKDFKKSLEYAEKAKNQFPEQYSANKLIQADVELQLALANAGGGEYMAALEHAERALEINTAIKHPDDPDVQSCHAVIGTCYWELGNHEKAASHLRVVRKTLQNAFPESHPLFLEMSDAIDHLSQEQL